MLCPNESGCVFNRYLRPLTNGEVDTFEKFEGTFVTGDLCNFKITNPAIDLNDVMYIKLEYTARCRAILIKGETLTNPVSLYTMNKGQDYTGLQGINFYLLFIAETTESADFVFRIWYKSIAGFGEETPTVVTPGKDPRAPEPV